MTSNDQQLLWKNFNSESAVDLRHAALATAILLATAGPRSCLEKKHVEKADLRRILLEQTRQFDHPNCEFAN
jgi:hypothetical protein